MDLSLTKDGDMYISESGDFALAESVTQKIRTKLLWFSGEWRWDTDAGIPYMEYLFVKNPDTDYVESLIREAIFEVDEVTDVQDVSVTYGPKSRKATIRFVAYTDQETIKEEVELSV